jgi:hypothetical protein
MLPRCPLSGSAENLLVGNDGAKPAGRRPIRGRAASFSAFAAKRAKQVALIRQIELSAFVGF